MQAITAPPPLLQLFDALVHSADAPSREALRLSRAPLFHSLARAAIGVLGLAASSLVIASLRTHPGDMVDTLSLVLETLLTVAPVTLVIAAWMQVASPRVMIAALSLGLLTAGWVAMGLAPLAAFTALVAPPTSVSSAGLASLDAFALMLAVTTVGSLAMVLRRVLLAIDPDPATQMLARAFGLASFAVLYVRAQPWLLRVLEELRAW